MTKKGPIKVHEKNTIPKRKTQISVRIPNEYIWKDFKRFVREKYGGHDYYYTGLEVETAFKKHLRDHKIDGYQDINLGPTVAHTKLLSADYDLLEYLEMMHEKGDVISHEELVNAMIIECDLRDDRTHNKHIRALVAKKILIKAGEDEDELYYYKQVPDEIPDTIKRQKILKDEHYSILVKNGFVNKEITVNELKNIWGLKTDFKPIIKKLEDKNLLEDIAIGKWRVLDMNNTDEYFESPQIYSETADYLKALESAKPLKDVPRKISRIP